ncbi:glycoside hydrolase family 3 protein [Azotosporobacter soli]|uniref:glycoside hydrolase family 3 protein n=1 Tax=Azotosporobacter soli TaxID=3055040 RepID=UPI0031FE868B
MKSREMKRRSVKMIYAAIIIFSLMVSIVSAAEQEDSVEARLYSMSLEQKVGQLMIGFFRGPVLSDELAKRLETLHLGGVILYGVSGNVENPRQIVALTDSLQLQMRTQGDVPLFISIDQEGGRVTRLTQGVTVFPGNMALGATGSEELAAKTAQVIARELHSIGINMNFAPVVDVNSNPANPVIGIRSFGSDPKLVARLGTAMLAPYRNEQVLCVAKHFPGHGDTAVDSHLGLPLAGQTRAELEETALYPFRQMIRSGVPAVMTAHVVVPALDESGLPATLSPTVVGLLRREIGSGLIITDSLSMGAIDQRWGMEEAAVQAFLAGADLLLFGADTGHEPAEQAAIHRALLAALKSGRITEKRLDESVRRILQSKERYGLLDAAPKAADEAALKELASPEYLAVAEEVAKASITLLRDKNHLLPLVQGGSIPLLWPKEYSAALPPLLAQCPNLKPCLLPLNATITDVPLAFRQAPLIVAGSYNLYRNRQWLELLKALPQERMLIAAMGVPYDSDYLPGVSTFLAVYGDQPVSVAALGAVLAGRQAAPGRLPVAAGK